MPYKVNNDRSLVSISELLLKEALEAIVVRCLISSLLLGVSEYLNS